MSAMDFAARGLALAYRKSTGAENVGTRIGSTVEERLAGFSSVAAMKALSPVPGDRVYLSFPGRWGEFIFSDDELSFAVATDTHEGIFIAPDSDPSGASGAWVRIFNGSRILALWFGWRPGPVGAANRDALQTAINVADLLYTFTPHGCVIVDLGSGSFDLGAPGDNLGITRKHCHIEGHGPWSTQIVWQGDENATVVGWDSTKRGHLKGVRFRNGSASTRPKYWIDATYDAGAAGGPRVTDWGDGFSNHYESVSDHIDAAALNFGTIVNYDDRGLRFEGGTRHIKITQPADATVRRTFRLSDYTFDFTGGGAGVFSEHILVDTTGASTLMLDLAPTRAEGVVAMAGDNPAFVRLTDSQGPDALEVEALTLVYRGGGIQFSGESDCWLVYHDTTQTNVHTSIYLPQGAFLAGFQGLQGGNWSSYFKAPEPTFSPTATRLPHFANPRVQAGRVPYIGRDPRYSGGLTGDGGAKFITGTGNPENNQSGAKGSLFLRTDGYAGVSVFYKTTGTEASPTTTGWVNLSHTSGAISATTDASGDVTVTHGVGFAPGTVQAQAFGTTLTHAMVHTIGGATFKVRFFDATGATLVSTAVTGSWMAKA